MTPGLRIDQAREFHIGRWLILAIVAALLCVGAYFGYNWYTKGDLPPLLPVPASAKADTTIDEAEITPAQISSYTVKPSQPRYISIPALNISNARIQQIGLTENNTLEMPKNIADAAWFTKSSTPGIGNGAVVIDGHSSGVNKGGVFAKLSTLRTGDTITIERGDGKKITYNVQQSVVMGLQEANTSGMQDMMKSLDPTKEGLSILTAAGNWVPRDKVFDKRVLVRAVAQD